jgi:hypothetical protein
MEQPLAEVLRERDEGLSQLRVAGVPYLTAHSLPP